MGLTPRTSVRVNIQVSFRLAIPVHPEEAHGWVPDWHRTIVSHNGGIEEPGCQLQMHHADVSVCKPMCARILGGDTSAHGRRIEDQAMVSDSPRAGQQAQ